MYHMPLEIKRHILGYCNISDIAMLAQACMHLNLIARDYVQHRLCLMTFSFFDNVDTLSTILRSCDAVVSGSCALHLLLPANDTAWFPSNLDIYVSCRFMTCITVLLEREGYQIVRHHFTEASPYVSSSIHSVISFSNKHRLIDVVISNTAAAVSPIFEFHSTTVMNFFSSDSIFCAYPTLTLHLMSLVNAEPIYFGPSEFKAMVALQKYAARGWQLVVCQDVHGSTGVCRSMPRSIADLSCLWINIANVKRVAVTPADVFERLGIINLIWLLGGYVCGAWDPFMRGQSFVIEDKSLDLLGGGFIGSEEA
ncbi:hypothetical protein BKA82DRAFT_20675 [Pisolithus tinctorius]|uniref:F-box domain-containing protein n=1 Tax=Pisolithus tinctorius Marx 270 TaxID=870435 RepID=A0A0C3PBT8_PISTI|nr:hypothetical protein BKA82DRAFT_20675 [Pisolithus tinctorius]KIO11185.1 hypothetical protein M404DRAFT_20675 [Pisolithus tinctorius Marx 270]